MIVTVRLFFKFGFFLSYELRHVNLVFVISIVDYIHFQSYEEKFSCSTTAQFVRMLLFLHSQFTPSEISYFEHLSSCRFTCYMIDTKLEKFRMWNMKKKCQSVNRPSLNSSKKPNFWTI